MRNKIWADLTDAKFTQIYTEITCQLHRKISKLADIFTIVFSGSGTVMGLAFWHKGAIFPVIGCGLTAIVQVLKQLSPKLFPKEKDYKNLDAIIAFYLKKYNALHRLWIEFENNEITDAEARKKYFEIDAKDGTILSVVNEILSDDNKKRNRKARRETELFISSHFK